MKIFRIWILTLLAAFGSWSGQAQVIISEVLYNEVGSDTTGEWIEIYNKGSTAVDLSNYKIGDEETALGTSATEALFQFPTGSSIAPGEVQIVAVGAARFFTVYGFLPTYELNGSDVSVPDMAVYSAWDPDGGVINMSNSNDQALLVNDLDVIIDGLNWGNTTFFNPGLLASVTDGYSYSRINALIDTDTAADWVVGTADLKSNPGIVVVPEPGAIALGALALAGLVLRRK